MIDQWGGESYSVWKEIGMDGTRDVGFDIWDREIPRHLVVKLYSEDHNLTTEGLQWLAAIMLADIDGQIERAKEDG